MNGNLNLIIFLKVFNSSINVSVSAFIGISMNASVRDIKREMAVNIGNAFSGDGSVTEIKLHLLSSRKQPVRAGGALRKNCKKTDFENDNVPVQENLLSSREATVGIIDHF